MMLFNSLNFALFVPLVFFLYWFTTGGSYKIQNILLLVSSYFFYACWDCRFLFLLFFSTLLDYCSGLKMQAAVNKNVKKTWFWISVIVNFTLLGVFKYYNFFESSFATALSALGININLWTLKVILPVGISFYTFHGLSYVIDIYKNKIKPEKSFVDYAVFVSFFPLLVAGPIERATHLLPQIQKKRTFDYSKATDGLRQILWGLFKKLIIADNCAGFANSVFSNYSHYNGSTLILGAIFFSIQIYCDFSGYSDIAVGTAKLFGIDLLKNFAFPYFSRNIAEFWRRWHISLSSWFRDYLYIPLGGSKGSTPMKVRNIFIIFLVSGLWHGANWTFISWGLLNALYILPSVLFGTNRNNLDIVAEGKLIPSFKEFFSIVLTFTLTVFAWIFFRSENVQQAFGYISKILSRSSFKWPEGKPFIENNVSVYQIMTIVGFFIIIEWLGREDQYAIAQLGTKFPMALRWPIYFLLIGFIYYFTGKDQQFIYFQF